MGASNVHSGRRLTLTDGERQFFSEISRFIFANPFSEERAVLLDGLLESGRKEPDVHALSARVMHCLERTDADGPARLEQFSAEDRPLMEAAYRYVAYHRYMDAYDGLIQRQLGEARPLPVDFADELQADLAARGFEPPAVARHIALFFQLRRAFYLIERLLPGDSPSMRGLRLALWNNTFTHDMCNFDSHMWSRMEEFSTLLLGETGTGKGSAAAAIGRSAFIPFDPRRKRFVASFADTFVSLNLSQFPESLVESELFGHRKGAFTGAIADHAGVFERCSEHGALFLDEMGEISAPLQVKLLEVLQERTFCPLGSHERLRFHGRVIAASNQPLDELRAQGRFRDDLYYRLCSDVIVMPPLRQRLQESPAELILLVRVLVERIIGERADELAGRVLDSLAGSLPRDYPWPGNVRELEQAVRRVLLAGSYAGDRREREVTPQDTFLAAVRAGRLDATQLLDGYCALLYGHYGSYVEVGRRTGLDRRTVRKHVDAFVPRR